MPRPSAPSTDVQVQIRVPAATHAALRTLAEARMVSVNYLVKRSIERLLDDHPPAP